MRDKIEAVSRILPLRPLGHQAADYPAHLPPSSRVPAPHDTHLDSTTSLIILLSLPLVLSLDVIDSVSCISGALFVFRVYCFVNLLKHSLYLLPDSQHTRYTLIKKLELFSVCINKDNTQVFP